MWKAKIWTAGFICISTTAPPDSSANRFTACGTALENEEKFLEFLLAAVEAGLSRILELKDPEFVAKEMRAVFRVKPIPKKSSRLWGRPRRPKRTAFLTNGLIPFIPKTPTSRVRQCPVQAD